MLLMLVVEMLIFKVVPDFSSEYYNTKCLFYILAQHGLGVILILVGGDVTLFFSFRLYAFS